MFLTNGNDYLLVYKARQQELEAVAQKERLVKELKQNADVSPLRQHIGCLLIDLGKKIAREPQQDVRLVLSVRHRS